MHKLLNALPAHAMLPGVTVLDDGVIFSIIFREKDPRGIVLYRLSDGRPVDVPLTDEYRFGTLYSVRITGLDPAEWGYLYYREEKGERREFEDPFARGFVSIPADGPDTDAPAGKGRRVCRLFPGAEDKLPVFQSSAAPAWEDQLLYCLHVRGFTMDPSSCASRPGTFEAAAEQIPYLQSLGVTGVVLQPVYEPRPGKPRFRDAEVPTYWWYGESFYCAPREEYGSPDPIRSFRDMVETFHEAGLLVLMQVSFPDTVSSQTQVEVLRFYVTHYSIDGFQLVGHVTALSSIATDPLLSDTLLLHAGFPMDEIRSVDSGHPERGVPDTAHLAECSDDYSRLVRRLIKSDDYCFPAFSSAFTDIPRGYGRVRYICGSDGFTLRDLVSYNEKHNDANGEENRDGENENLSWNCGTEGESDNPEVLKLRRQQARNFLTLLFLSQGGLLLRMGDERWNTQEGNNNPYGQDNPLGWMNWEMDSTAAEILEYVRRLSAFRAGHPVLRMRTPFRGTDYLSVGFPDLSLHGKEAWRPRIDNFSHTLGWMFCENYAGSGKAQSSGTPSLLYIGLNTYWEEESLALPRLPAGYQWDLVIDTADERGFLPGLNYLRKPEITLAPRSMVVLLSKPVPVREKKKPAPWNDHKLYFGGKSAAIDRQEMSPRIKERLFRLQRGNE